MRFPLRKCYYVVKLSIFLVIIVTILTLFEHWRGGKRSARAQDLELIQDELEKQILEDEARIIPGLGEGGVAAHLVGAAKRLGEESEKELAVNVYLSDRIAYNRTLKDFRNPACTRVTYDAELPSASVIIIFHNEPYSVVIRTLWSVVNSARRDQPWYKEANFIDRATGKTMNLGYPGQDPNSPFVYLKEIILVDDNSTLPELKGKLSHYIRTRLPPDLIRILRLPDRVGLTRARLEGARYAEGDVLTFLDSHCEAQPDWLRPLLQRIKDSPNSVVVPIIDVIESSNFYYSVQDPAVFQVGGFTFTGSFTWIEVPEREKKRRGSAISPTWSPTMAGGLFAINRAYYWELGAYDEQMAGWGGENLEMSFRIWQCGGTLETIPCSRVGHVFRNFHPYGMPRQSDTHGINTARMAEVWMDDYAELFYMHRPDLRKNPSIGDVTHRKILREKLQCKNFQWYLEHVYKEKFVPVRDVYGFGRFLNPSTGLCLDTLQREEDGAPLGVYPCHETLQATQYLSLSLIGQLRDEEKCAKIQFTRQTQEEEATSGGRKVLMVACHDNHRGQKWRYLGSKQLQHVESGLCLEVGPAPGADAVAARCRTDLPAQRWLIDYNEDNAFGHPSDGEPSEQQLRLERLRGQRRKSRSLLSYEANEVKEEMKEATEETRRAHKSKKHGKKSKRRSKKQSKNKFILKLVRSLSNGTEEHLEADIHCIHKRLYPNNTFVRDLVTYLNDNDVKVINNGRIFERTKISEMGKDHKAGKVLKKLEVAPMGPITPRSATPQNLQPHTQSSLLQPWRSKKAKAGRQGSEERPVEALAMNVDPQSGQRNKIIVEEFVEVKPYEAHSKAPQEKKMKRKRRRRRTTPLPLYPMDEVAESPLLDPVQRSQHWDDYEKVDQSSGEDNGAMMISIESNQPTRTAGIYPPTTLLQRLQHGRPNFRANTLSDSSNQVTGSDDDRPARGQEKEPVKLVMKSNLTFNLGEEFFNWRRNGDDIAHLLNELGIPVNISRSIENWRKTQSNGETTVNVQYHNTTKSSPKESESSESYESSSKE